MITTEKIRQKIRLLPIDFSHPWWQLISAQKGLFAAISAITVIVRIFWALNPFLIAKILELQSISACALFFIVWLCIDLVNVYSRQINAVFQLQCIHSIYQSTHRHLLTIDPHYHIHRSSGTILGKIERAARGYEELLDQISFEFIPLSVGLISMITTVSQFSPCVAGGIALVFIGMVGGGYYFARFFCRSWENSFITTDDTFKQTAVENLAQIHLIRSSFASDYMDKKLHDTIIVNARSEMSLWLSYIAATFFLNMAYLITIFTLISVLTWQVTKGLCSLVSAVGLVLAYLHSTKEIVSIVKPFRRYMRGWAAVTDLFDFMRTFGSQTYPVLGQPYTERMPPLSDIMITATDISFDYGRAVLFNNHTLMLTCTYDMPNKLFGIIGPSGSGKTTLLSLLGGQIKPQKGTVTINDCDIYAINDSTRRHYIALQGQIATHLRGTVRYNITFGLPAQDIYNDTYLLSVIHKVGLATVLTEGLDTMLGEGGLNVSGGQRQRLNFASLYIRAHYYNPLVILIDEPTSSLDEISEAAITDMIGELSHNAITLVIAHRLKTVTHAVGLIDLSLLHQENSIRSYTAEELAKKSLYYQQLIHGKVMLDS